MSSQQKSETNYLHLFLKGEFLNTWVGVKRGCIRGTREKDKKLGCTGGWAEGCLENSFFFLVWEFLGNL